MADTYWLTFRIESDSGYSQRYDRLTEAIRKITDKWWTESTSFIVFRSAYDIDAIASIIKDAFNPHSDVALIGKSDFKAARVVGNSRDGDVFELIPFAKKAA